MLVNWKCAVASKFRGRATKSNQTWAKQRLLRLVRASSNFLTVRTRGRVSRLLIPLASFHLKFQFSTFHSNFFTLRTMGGVSPLGFPLASVLFEFSVFQLLIPIFSQRRQEGVSLLLLFPLASFKLAASSNAPPSFHRAAPGSFRRRRSPERRAVGIPPLPIVILLSYLPFPLPRCRHLGKHTN